MNDFKFTKLPEGFRFGTKEDVPLILLTLAQAFADYEYPIPSMKTTHSALLHYNYEYFDYVVDNAFKYGTVLANTDFSAVLVVVPLEKICITPLDLLAEHMKQNASLEVVENMVAIINHLDELEKDLTFNENTIYIEGIAVQTPKQGKKLCSSLMRHLFAECDQKECDILLYTNTFKNRAIYEHLGFECVLIDHSEELNSDTFIMVRHFKSTN